MFVVSIQLYDSYSDVVSSTTVGFISVSIVSCTTPNISVGGVIKSRQPINDGNSSGKSKFGCEWKVLVLVGLGRVGLRRVGLGRVGFDRRWLGLVGLRRVGGFGPFFVPRLFR